MLEHATLPSRGHGHAGQATSLWTPRSYRQWKSRILMVAFLFLGFGMSLTHCVYYPSLQGRIVGDSYSQENQLR